jgi:hypothetical protein
VEAHKNTKNDTNGNAGKILILSLSLSTWYYRCPNLSTYILQLSLVFSAKISLSLSLSLSPPDIIDVRISQHIYFNSLLCSQPKSLSLSLSLSLCVCCVVEGCAMGDRIIFRRDTSRESKGSVTLQKKLVESTRCKAEPAPDLTDFMNDMFFRAGNADKKVYNLTGDQGVVDEEDEDFDSSSRSNSSRMTQQWLEEARRMVSSSPTRCDSPSKLISSPRFAAAQGSPAFLDRRDPLSRSTRR